MSQNDQVNFKVFLKRGGDIEVRRFSVGADVVTNFLFLREKLQSLFPFLRDNDFKITWTDADGDAVTITSDEELIIALTEMKDNLKVLHVNANLQRTEIEDDGEALRFLPQVICDGCETIITDLRYKCIQCPDFDLCVKCETQGLHPEHVMLRFSMNQYEIPRGTGKMLHNFFRGLRKSGYQSGRHHHKENKERRGKCQQEQTRRPTEGGCPFSSRTKEDEIPWQGLQEMARPYVDALLQGLNTQGCGEGAELIRNIARGIFGENAPAGSNDSKTEQPQPQKESEKGKSSDKPMDVDAEGQRDTIVIDDGPSSSNNAPSAPPVATPENPSHPDPVIAEGLKQLREMGFSNHEVLTELLRKHGGNLPYVIRDLVAMTKQ